MLTFFGQVGRVGQDSKQDGSLPSEHLDRTSRTRRKSRMGDERRRCGGDGQWGDGAVPIRVKSITGNSDH